MSVSEQGGRMKTELDRQRWVREEAIRGDASSRCYFRLWDAAGTSVVLAQYPDGPGNTLVRDLEVLGWLQERRLRVPRVIGSSVNERWVLLEDMGTADAEQELRRVGTAHRRWLARRLVSPLALLADLAPETLPPWNEPLGRRRLRWELAGFELWFICYRCRVEPDGRLGSWLDDLAREVAGHPQRICHRDYHLNNLFFLRDDEIGVIDFQDTLLGPDTYDATSLVHERAFPELLGDDVCQSWLRHWAEATGATSGWAERCRLTRLQRALKVLGTFARLELSGRSEYSTWIQPLATAIAPIARALDAPGRLLHLLLD
jgi:aminoglycoside/choline kinase family phosphotransferase